MYQNLERATPVHPWMDDASCQNDPDPDLWFRGAEVVRPADREAAIAICSTCRVQTACLNFALTENLTDGIFGGLLPEQRRNIKRQAKRN